MSIRKSSLSDDLEDLLKDDISSEVKKPSPIRTIISEEDEWERPGQRVTEKELSELNNLKPDAKRINTSKSKQEEPEIILYDIVKSNTVFR